MLNELPKNGIRVFQTNAEIMRRNFNKQRRIAARLKNSRILQITFHTFRRWKATMEYAKTHVVRILGHKRIENTLIYTQLVEFKTDEYISKVARNAKEACELVEAGFNYVCTTPDGFMIFRKRK